ncbi:DUF202 domain-containing protein [Kitasatospora griseola]|uniref:DUF202 domain-containing protein n=1 Tax=Kitasatospora griseola TaxID=2064 RepID=UPI0036D878F1
MNGHGERTLLAWSRTALVLAVDALLVLRTALIGGEPGLLAVGGGLALAAVGFCVFGMRGRGPVAGEWPVRALTAVVVVAAVGTAWCALVSRGR